jgi:hypothetical protein
MKIVSSFISNSSSSSFILVGVELTGEEFEKNEEYIQNNLDVIYDDDGDTLVGRKIASSIEEDGNGSWDLSFVDGLKGLLQQISNKPIKIYYGNEQC